MDAKEKDDAEHLLKEALHTLTEQLAFRMAKDAVPTPVATVEQQVKQQILAGYDNISYLRDRIHRGVGLLITEIRKD